MDMDLVQKAFENDDNICIINTNIQEIKAKKNNILQQLGLKRDDLKSYHTKLKGYRYIDDIKDIIYGRNIRWINLNNIENIKISNGALSCEIKILDKGVALILKSFNNKFITLYLSQNLIFQKLSNEELCILKAFSYLNK